MSTILPQYCLFPPAPINGGCSGASRRGNLPRPAGQSRSRYALAMPEPKPDDVTFHEVTDSAIYADDRNFYKVEKWTKDGSKVDSLLYGGNSLTRARAVFERAIKHRPRIRLTIRQRTRVIDQWPKK
jgi:hypothetical protein